MLPSDREKYNDSAAGIASRVTLLADQARAGNKTAFEQLVAVFHRDIFRMVYYRTRNRPDAEDITQEVFMSAFNNLTRLKDAERFRPWLFRIGMNSVRDFFRKKKVRSIFGYAPGKDVSDNSDTENDDLPDAVDMLMKQEFWRHIDLLLDQLSRVEREVFLLKFMDHLTIKEISQVLKKSESSVKTHLYRALKKFRKDADLNHFFREDMP